MDTFRYGNLADERVYVDNTIQYNVGASKSREGFARVAQAYIKQGEKERAVELLDRALEVLPTSQIRFTDSNTVPLIEAYYNAEEWRKGDDLIAQYAQNIVEYIDYYLQFDSYYGEMITSLLDEKLDEFEQIYLIAAYANRLSVMAEFNNFYRSLGIPESDLLLVDATVNPADSVKLDLQEKN